MLGTLFVLFWCHHPNRPQALVQLTLGQFDDFVKRRVPMEFHGKTEASSGAQTLVFAEQVTEYVQCYVQYARKPGKREDPLFVTFNHCRLKTGDPAKCTRAFCASVFGPEVRLTPTDLFKASFRLLCAVFLWQLRAVVSIRPCVLTRLCLFCALTRVSQIFAERVMENDPSAIRHVLKARGTSEAVFQKHYDLTHPEVTARRSHSAYAATWPASSKPAEAPAAEPSGKAKPSEAPKAKPGKKRTAQPAPPSVKPEPRPSKAEAADPPSEGTPAKSNVARRSAMPPCLLDALPPDVLGRLRERASQV